MTKQQTFLSMIAQSSRIVFLGGAGVSTASGIPDFRSEERLYHQGHAISPEEILSHSFFLRQPAAFYAFYRQHMLYPHAKPNLTHKALARLEQQGKLTAVVTQNIDGLHQAAGSKAVYELHGSVHRNHCSDCDAYYSLQQLLQQEEVPRCSQCGGIIKPDVVLYEEALDGAVLDGAIREISRAEMLIVGGTSLNVYPAAGLIRYYGGRKLVLINKSETPYDGYANLVMHCALEEAFAPLIGEKL